MVAFWICDSKSWNILGAREIQTKVTDKTTIELRSISQIISTPITFFEYVTIFSCVGVVMETSSTGCDLYFSVLSGEGERMLKVIRMCEFPRKDMTNIVEVHITSGAGVIEGRRR